MLFQFAFATSAIRVSAIYGSIPILDEYRECSAAIYFPEW